MILCVLLTRIPQVPGEGEAVVLRLALDPLIAVESALAWSRVASRRVAFILHGCGSGRGARRLVNELKVGPMLLRLYALWLSDTGARSGYLGYSPCAWYISTTWR